jgi:hypothetical protein
MQPYILIIKVEWIQRHAEFYGILLIKSEIKENP